MSTVSGIAVKTSSDDVGTIVIDFRHFTRNGSLEEFEDFVSRILYLRISARTICLLLYAYILKLTYSKQVSNVSKK